MTGVPLNIDFQQILLHLLNFAILFFVLYLILYKPVRKFIDQRNAKYKELDDQAKANLEASEKAKVEYLYKMENAEKEAAAAKVKAMDEANEYAKERVNAAHAEAERIIANAQNMAEAERDKIIAEAGQQIEDLAKEAAKKAIFENTSEAMDSFLDAVEEK
ncbi:MAG: ATP synthase F0 subunit B [Lachnospiraceae bacterium]|nr:ATP synthase F0 subunit B [Lachnospiraceae bacterium]